MRPSFTYIFSGIFIAYILHGVWTLAQLFQAPNCSKNCIKTFLYKDPKLQLILFTSVKASPSTAKQVQLIDHIYDFDYKEPFTKSIDVPLPLATRRNGSLHLHVFIAPRNIATESNFWELQNEPLATHVQSPLTKWIEPMASTYRLLDSNSNRDEDQTPTKKSSDLEPKPESHFHSIVHLDLMADLISFPSDSIPVELRPWIFLTRKKEFLPIIIVDFLKSRLKDLVHIKLNNTSQNMTFIYSPISLGKFRMMLQFGASFSTLHMLGFTEKDVDEVKGIFADTNLILLCLTIVISAMHLLFDFLAFKHDVSFWRHLNPGMTGLSPRTVAWRAFSQAVVFFYLLDENTSLLVLGPAGIGTLIEIWKTSKVLKVEFGSYYIPRFRAKAEPRTRALDAEAMRYLSYLLYPLCLCGAVYSLLYQPHRSWYSWCIQSMVNGVYAFGFLFMLPQLFVNYKLKSVAHLPWRSFMYKAFNTFIDDVFAFIITMPTAHRVACFRDDIVFLIYLYQRWLYPVDKSRRDEADSTIDNSPNNEGTLKKKKE